MPRVKEEARNGARGHMRISSLSRPERAQHIAFSPFWPEWLGASASGDQGQEVTPFTFLSPSLLLCASVVDSYSQLRGTLYE